MLGTWDEDDGLYADVWGDGNYAYVPNGRGGDPQPPGVHIIDISNPANPVLDETLFIPPPHDDASSLDVKVGDGLLFVGLNSDSSDSVAIYDVRNPASRQLVATVRIPGFESVHNLFYDNGFLYLAPCCRDDFVNSIAIVDLTSFDPDNPPDSPITEAKWVVDNIGTDRVHDVTARNGRMYVAALDSGLWIYDVSDIANTTPTLLGAVDGESTHSMWPTDDGKFVVTGEERAFGGIQVYQISESNGSFTLTLTDSFFFAGPAISVHNQVIVGYRLYNSWYQEGLQVFDINPLTGQLEFVGSFDTGTTTAEFTGNWGVYPFLGEDRILLSDKYNGLLVVNLFERACLASSEPELMQIPATVGGSLIDLTENRTIGLNAGAPGQQQAIRIRFESLPPPIDVWDGAALWVTEPQDICDLSGVVDPANPACGAPLKIAGLTCDSQQAFFTDWSTVGDFYVQHPGIVPDGLYRVQILDSSCDAANECLLSTGTSVQNSVFGDISGGFDPGVALWLAPDGEVGIPTDVLAAIGAFSNTPGNVSKLRADVEPCVLDFKVNISDIVLLLDAFRGLPYSFAPGELDCPLDPCSAGTAASVVDAEGNTDASLNGLRREQRAPLTDARSLGWRTVDDEGAVQDGARPESIIYVEPSRRALRAGEEFTVDVYADGVVDLRSYQISLGVHGGERGSIEVEDLWVDDHRLDFVFAGLRRVDAVDHDGARLAGALVGGGVETAGPVYLGTYRLRASSDASGRFKLDLGATGSSQLSDSRNNRVPFVVPSVAVSVGKSSRWRPTRR